MRFGKATRAVSAGRIVGVPTDTVYGLAVDPRQAAAVRMLFEIKGRPAGNPIGLLAASFDDVETLVVVPPRARHLAARHWPGPLTLVVASAVELPDWVGDHERNTVAVRVPDHPLARRLFAATGPLAVTSANLSGEPPATDHRSARAAFGDAVSVYLPGTCPGGTASTVVDMTLDPPRVLRAGPIDI